VAFEAEVIRLHDFLINFEVKLKNNNFLRIIPPYKGGYRGILNIMNRNKRWFNLLFLKRIPLNPFTRRNYLAAIYYRHENST
jgi:hypothetical protein